MTTSLNLGVGDVVMVGMEEQFVLKTALVVYGLPVLSLLIGAWLGREINIASFSSDILSMAAGLVFFSASVFVIKIWDRRLRRLNARPIILRKISGPILPVSSG